MAAEQKAADEAAAAAAAAKAAEEAAAEEAAAEAANGFHRRRPNCCRARVGNDGYGIPKKIQALKSELRFAKNH